MSRDGDRGSIIGINWASNALRAYLIDADGRCIDEVSEPAGVVGLDAAGMAAQVDALVGRWPDSAARYASGMVGSPLGWMDVGYADAPAGVAELAASTTAATIGMATVEIVRGVACVREHDSGPDVMRGEEIEAVGLAAGGTADGLVVLPGAHSKWVRMQGGCVVDFFTAISGEIEARLTQQGLLASVVSGDAGDGPAFQAGITAGLSQAVSLATSLFGIRPRVVCGSLATADARSYLRGLLIGSEIADARRVLPNTLVETAVTVREGPLGDLYAAALASIGVVATRHTVREACVAGFHALHEARRG